jgi:hypothetical protein
MGTGRKPATSTVYTEYMKMYMLFAYAFENAFLRIEGQASALLRVRG